MPQKRSTVVAATLQTEMPELSVFTAPYTHEANQVSCADNPVVVVSDGIAQGFTITVYGEDGDDIDSLAADVFRKTQKGFHLPDPQIPSDLKLIFRKSDPVFDESDYHIGQRMHFGTIEHSSSVDVAA